MEPLKKFIPPTQPPANLPNFKSYYTALNIFPCESDYTAFFDCLLKDLPISFRLNILQ